MALIPGKQVLAMQSVVICRRGNLAEVKHTIDLLPASLEPGSGLMWKGSNSSLLPE